MSQYTNATIILNNTEGCKGKPLFSHSLLCELPVLWIGLVQIDSFWGRLKELCVVKSFPRNLITMFDKSTVFVINMLLLLKYKIIFSNSYEVNMY